MFDMQIHDIGCGFIPNDRPNDYDYLGDFFADV